MKMTKDELHRLIVQQSETIAELREERDIAYAQLQRERNELLEARSTLHEYEERFAKLADDTEYSIYARSNANEWTLLRGKLSMQDAKIKAFNLGDAGTYIICPTPAATTPGQSE